MDPTKKLLMAASLVTALSIGIAATAGADIRTVQVKTEVRFVEVNKTTFREFTGKIAAQKPCADDRLATLWYMPSGQAPQKLGTDETNRKGAFDIDLTSPAVMGMYAVSIKKLIHLDDLGDDDFVKYVCKGVKPIYKQF